MPIVPHLAEFVVALGAAVLVLLVCVVLTVVLRRRHRRGPAADGGRSVRAEESRR